MLINGILCVLSLVGTTLLYQFWPVVSLWWLPLLFIVGYVLFGVLELVGVLVFSYFMRGASDTPYRRFFYRLISFTAEWVVLLCGTRCTIEGDEKLPKGIPFLLVSNHLSNFDPLATMAVLRRVPLAFVSKPENFKIPVAGPIMRNAAFLPIDRENPRNAVSTIKTATQQIAQERLCMGIYPEGTRNKSGIGLLPFHHGSFKIATTAKCPVAILTIRYEKAAFPLRRKAHIRVVDVLDEGYVTANRTDAISAQVKKRIENDLGL